jgi:acetolactate synthase-1/2/3 large subunit
MKQRVADYIADFLVSCNITDVFTVTGGGAMHLNDAFGHHSKLHCTYNHHEQACAIAAEAYARVNNNIAAVCVTTGPGGSNAITGVLGGWLDSIPMLIISGQVRYDTTVRFTGLNLRSLGIQEFDILKAVSCMTKYAEMVIDPEHIRYSLEKAIFLAKSGRPGPSWLDIPLNVQGATIETDSLVGYDHKKENGSFETPVSSDVIDTIIEKIKESERPVVIAGSAIRYSNGFDVFSKLIEQLKIPVVSSCGSIDLISDDDPLYIGRIGINGDRPGNFSVQNSDLVISLGNRLSLQQIGFNFKAWAREAYTIVVDIDPNELKKHTLHIDLPICADVIDVMKKLLAQTENDITAKTSWMEWCKKRKEKYPVVQQKHYDEKELVNVYVFFKEISSFLPEDYYTVVGVGSARIVGIQAYIIKKGQRFIAPSGLAAMGYDLPAAIGVCIAHGREEIVCITGDGSIQMNFQELQTIITNKLPIKIFIINNRGYHSIRQTQKNFFGEPLVGIGYDSGDLEFPDMAKIAYAYGYPYKKCTCNNDLKSFIQQTFEEKGAVISEVIVSTAQFNEPKSANKRLDNGTLFSAPLEDMAPFLSREEFQENMLIKPLE